MAGIGIGRHDYLCNDTPAQKRIVRNGFRLQGCTCRPRAITHSSASFLRDCTRVRLRKLGEQFLTLDLESPATDLERLNVVLHPGNVTRRLASIGPVDR